MPYPDNDYTAYGSPLHEALQKVMLEYAIGIPFDSDVNYKYFLDRYQKNVEDILEKGSITEDLSPENIIKFANAGEIHIQNVIKYLETEFGDFEVVSVEEAFEELIDVETEHYKFLFRGMMDLVIQTTDGIYHVIDWKTSSNGWSEFKKNESIYFDQLFFYKFFFHKIHEIPLEQISAHFIILESSSHEIDKVSIDTSAIEYARIFKTLETMVFNIFERKWFPKKGMCGNFCDCKKFYFDLPTPQ